MPVVSGWLLPLVWLKWSERTAALDERQIPACYTIRAHAGRLNPSQLYRLNVSIAEHCCAEGE
jgi:hypothetical protein